MSESVRADALRAWQAGLLAVDGRTCVRHALADRVPDAEEHVIAVGKAAVAMMRGAVDVLGERLASGLVISPAGGPAGHDLESAGLRHLHGDHPLPGDDSLAAGRALVRYLSERPSQARVLFLISGGSSSLVEWPVRGIDLHDLRDITRWLLGSGLDIRAINAVRNRLSRIKGGGLLRWLAGRRARALYLSDVPGDDPAIIGSGLLVPSTGNGLPPDLPAWIAWRLTESPEATETAGVTHRVIGNLGKALEAAGAEAAALGYPVRVHSRFLDGEAAAEGRTLAEFLAGAPEGFHVWGGEPAVILPDRPGRGGRCQHLALAAATALRDSRECGLLAAGTDGIDGASEDAGAIVDGGTCHRGELEGLDAAHTLATADAGPFLEATGDLVSTSPTGTNVRDLVIGWRRPV